VLLTVLQSVCCAAALDRARASIAVNMCFYLLLSPMARANGATRRNETSAVLSTTGCHSPRPAVATAVWRRPLLRCSFRSSEMTNFATNRDCRSRHLPFFAICSVTVCCPGRLHSSCRHHTSASLRPAAYPHPETPALQAAQAAQHALEHLVMTQVYQSLSVTANFALCSVPADLADGSGLRGPYSMMLC